MLVWMITSRFYNNWCNADPCKGIAYTNWLCCHDSLGGTSLVWWISSQACSSSSFQSADDHIEVVKMCWQRYEERSNICTRRRGCSSCFCRNISSLIVFAYVILTGRRIFISFWISRLTRTLLKTLQILTKKKNLIGKVIQKKLGTAAKVLKKWKLMKSPSN